MHIRYHEYLLRNRQGALLQVYFEDGCVGYADCHPWTFLGDVPLQEQLEMLKNGKYTSLTQRSLHYARVDGEARHRKVSLFHSLKIPPSHYLVADLQKAQIPPGFTHVKVKLGKNLAAETPLLLALMKKGMLKFRLDFNDQLTQERYLQFIEELGSGCSQIDFCEDPFPYDEGAWEVVQRGTAVPLACDRDSERAIGKPRSAEVLVIKPAIQDPAPFLNRAHEHKQKLVFTSYLDHPLGQLAAAYEAAKAGVVVPCGLLTHLDCADHSFAQLLGQCGNVLVPPVGTGFGFDKELAGLKWTMWT